MKEFASFMLIYMGWCDPFVKQIFVTQCIRNRDDPKSRHDHAPLLRRGGRFRRCHARGIALTAAGEQLLVYARKIVGLNDEVVGRLTEDGFEGEIVLGVPHDIVYPAIPRVLQQFNAAYPRVRVTLNSSFTRSLKAEFARGKSDLILTTETRADPDCETLARLPLRWIGAPGGAAWRQRPLRIAFGRHCTFRPRVIEALDRAAIGWDLAVESDSDRTIEATVSADLAVHTMIDGTEPPHLVQIDHGGALPDLPVQMINLYTAKTAKPQLTVALADLLRSAFGAMMPGRARAAAE
jgi:DNA-binding transcriptional LysR family regulator